MIKSISNEILVMLYINILTLAIKSIFKKIVYSLGNTDSCLNAINLVLLEIVEYKVRLLISFNVTL